eukprot:3547784-Rhodomonas_salina.1
MVGILTESSFTDAVASDLSRALRVPVVASPMGNAVKELSAFVGEAFELTAIGAPKLLDCEPGYLLVRPSRPRVGVPCPQCACSVLPPRTRSTRRTGAAETKELGAICRGGDSFEPKVPGTLWRVEFFASETAWLYRIQWAPPGYIMIRGESPVDDQTVSCGAGWYALEPGIPGGDVMFKPNLAAEVPEDRLCLKCPKGAILFSFPPSNVPLPL